MHKMVKSMSILIVLDQEGNFLDYFWPSLVFYRVIMLKLLEQSKEICFKRMVFFEL